MELYKNLWNALSVDERSLDELLNISITVDRLMHNDKKTILDNDSNGELIAKIIFALLNTESTAKVGEKLYAGINNLIVDRNLLAANKNGGKEVAEKLNGEETAGKFRVIKIKNGYKFDVVRSNGEIVMTSQVYSREDSCIKGVDSVIKCAVATIDDTTIDNAVTVHNPKFQIYTDKANEFRFRLKAKNGEIIGVSAGYSNKNKCLSAVAQVIKAAGNAYIEKA